MYNKDIQYLEYNIQVYRGNEDTVVIWVSNSPGQVDS